MPTISRGYQLPAPVEPAEPHLALVPKTKAPVEIEPDLSLHLPPVLPDYHQFHDRLTMSPDHQQFHDRLTSLERLTRLFDQGALSAEEFAAEKALILGMPADELILRKAAPVSFRPARPKRPAPGPPLFGRMLNWQFLVTALLIGLAFSFVTQPDTTLRLFEQTARYFTG